MKFYTLISLSEFDARFDDAMARRPFVTRRQGSHGSQGKESSENSPGHPDDAPAGPRGPSRSPFQPPADDDDKDQPAGPRGPSHSPFQPAVDDEQPAAPPSREAQMFRNWRSIASARLYAIQAA